MMFWAGFAFGLWAGLALALIVVSALAGAILMRGFEDGGRRNR